MSKLSQKDGKSEGSGRYSCFMMMVVWMAFVQGSIMVEKSMRKNTVVSTSAVDTTRASAIIPSADSASAPATIIEAAPATTVTAAAPKASSPASTSSSSTPAAAATTSNNNPNCPAAITNNRGLYKNATKASRFQDTVLLVTLNYGYYDLLQNWEWLANQHGLKWAVVAMDDALYKELGPERAVRSDVSSKLEHAKFRQRSFNQISCNKMRIVQSIMKTCHVNVVFSDVDNIVLRDPFYGSELGNMIASNYFHYIYQPNLGKKGRRYQRGVDRFPQEANTGFYYMSHASEFFVDEAIGQTLQACTDSKSRLDDQKLFWGVMNDLKGKGDHGTSKYIVKHCNKEIVKNVLSGSLTKESLNPNDVPMCNMDGLEHPIGIGHYESSLTFHANYASGKEAKIIKMKEVRRDGYGWDDAHVYKQPDVGAQQGKRRR